MKENEISTSSKENSENLLMDDQENLEQLQDKLFNDQENIRQLPDIFDRLKLNFNYFGNFEIEPDLYYENKYYFFDLNNLKEKLIQKLNGILNDYKYMFKPIKQDLLEYAANLEEKPFVERPRTKFEKFRRKIHYFFYPNHYNQNERANAIKLANIIHEINIKEQQNNIINYYYIGSLDDIYANITFLNYTFLQKIDEEIKVIEFGKNNDAYIEILWEKIKYLKNIIQEFNKKEQYIFINFLIKISIVKFKEKDNLYNTGIIKEETKKIMYELCNLINSLIYEFNYKSERNSNILFKSINFRNIEIKISKDISNEKEIFINKLNIKKFYKKLLDELDLRVNNILCNNIFHDNTTKENFKNYVKKQIDKLKIENFELMKLKNNIYNKRKNDNKNNKKDKSNQSTTSTIIDKLVEYINNNNFDLDEQDKKILNKENEINEEKEKILIEIIKIIDLKDLIIKKVNEAKNKNMKGIMITKRLNDKYQLFDSFIIDAIHF